MGSIHVVFLAFLMHLVRSECPDIYRRFSTNHTFCLSPKTTCNIIEYGMNDTQIQLLLRQQNEVRSKIANGERPIADMLQMEWDPELADIAQKHAGQCTIVHDCDRCRAVQNYSSVNQRSSMTSDDNVTNSNNYWLLNTDSKTWKVGCGYVAFKDEDGILQKLFTCYYGSSATPHWGKETDEGAACSKCPKNTCCNCRKPGYAGVCQVIEGKRPDYYQPKAGEKFYCDFSEDHPCGSITYPYMTQWKVFPAVGNPYISIVLKARKLSVLRFETTIKAMPVMCFSTTYRKGPNVAEQKESNDYTVKFYLSNGTAFATDLVPFSQRSEMSKYVKISSNSYSFNMDFTFTIIFGVPQGAPDQYLDIFEISVREGQCPESLKVSNDTFPFF